jgi:hypothetical protein
MSAKNLGFTLALWDWLFGTLYLPREREKLEFGMTRKPRIQFARRLADAPAAVWRSRQSHGTGAEASPVTAGHLDRPDQQRPADFR